MYTAMISMLSGLTNTSGTTARSYCEEGHAGTGPAVNSAPTGVAVFADDFKSMRPFADVRMFFAGLRG